MAELRQLRYFVAVAEEGQITRAAGRLHIAQPALSQAIAHLEQRLGVPLFVRHPRGMTLTPAGEAYLDAAQTALGAIADADRAAQSHAGTDIDRVEWGFIAFPPALQAPQLFGAFTAAHPDALVSFRELGWPRETTATWLGEVDVALCFSPTPHPDVQLHPLRIEPRVVVLSKTHHLAGRSELAVQDVLHETFCGDDPSLEQVRAGFWKLNDHRGAPANTTTDRASNAFELLSCISTGRSIATGPASSVAPLLSGMPGLAAIPLRDARPTVLCLVWHTSNRNPLVDAIVAMARGLGNGATSEPAVQLPASLHG